MSLALIQETAKEVRRLSIAGSSLAVGDFRLKKLATPLEQAGAKVPVFAQVAKAINDLVNGTEADSTSRLLSLSTLLNAILYTQGTSSVEGDVRELEVFASKCTNTQTPARVLKPLVQALTTTGGGRFEIVKSACERGAFNDLRLIDPAIRALGDTYPELADLVAEKILPAYGPGIVPRLKQTFDLKGKKQDGRRLQIIHQLDPEGTLELCKTALEEGSPEVKASAIVCLGKHEDCLPIVLEQAKSKNKTLRSAALAALAEYDRPEVVKLFTELIKGKTLDILAQPFQTIRNQQVVNSLLNEGRRLFDLMVKGDEEQIHRYSEVLDCLKSRKDAEVEEFIFSCFSQCDSLAKLKAAKTSYISGADIMVRLASLLQQIGSPKALEAVLAKRDVLPAQAFPQVLSSALALWPGDKVFEEFSPLLEQKKGAVKEKNAELQRVIWRSSHTSGGVYEFDGFSDDEAKKIRWDPRWLDAAIKADQESVVFCLARPDHSGATSYLLKLLEDKKRSQQAGLIIEALAACQYPKLTDLFLEMVKKKTKNAQYFDWELQQLFGCAGHLPAADLPKLDEFATTLEEKFVDRFLEALGPLRQVKTNQT